MLTSLFLLNGGGEVEINPQKEKRTGEKNSASNFFPWRAETTIIAPEAKPKVGGP